MRLMNHENAAEEKAVSRVAPDNNAMKGNEKLSFHRFAPIVCILFYCYYDNYY